MWLPLEQDKLLEMIDNAERMMEPAVRAFWERIKIKPQKWQQSPMGDEGGGFWVVGIVGQMCVFYDDIEHGFTTSTCQFAGRIEEIDDANQSDLLTFINGYYSDFMADIAVLDKTT